VTSASFSGPEPFFWLFGLIPILFWAAVIWLIVMLVRRGQRQPPPNGPYSEDFATRQPKALAILEERYARGEISRDEFVERRAVLLGGTAAPGGSTAGAAEPTGWWAPAETPPPTPPPPEPPSPTGPQVPPPPTVT
jgi:putative membrane protein